MRPAFRLRAELSGAPHQQPRLARWLRPPEPLIHNRSEARPDAPLGRWNLYIGGANRSVSGFVNLDIDATSGVDVQADAHALPFRDGQFTRVECDAVLEHVIDPRLVMREIARVLEPGGWAHVVAPFCHPFHAYPNDYRRFTPEGLRTMRSGLEEVAAGWRTGPAATMLVFIFEFAKMLLPWRWWRVLAHAVLGWTLWPLRYLDLYLLRSPYVHRLGNHCYIWLRKPGA